MTSNKEEEEEEGEDENDMDGEEDDIDVPFMIEMAWEGEMEPFVSLIIKAGFIPSIFTLIQVEREEEEDDDDDDDEEEEV